MHDIVFVNARRKLHTHNFIHVTCFEADITNSEKFILLLYFPKTPKRDKMNKLFYELQNNILAWYLRILTH